ncbi:hypothetical protein [uncultured Tateyamaria sp.]|uniref:hypothetical protein n=1 Tax=uncultured Tateyamaria sp. TaxID=455651 RepID=UPI002639CBA7|nr:hypothetical protein [uncultured Tateyamaria sp.]
MTLPVWPDSLPPPARAQFQAQRQDNRRRLSNDTGLPAYRRRTSQGATQENLTVVLDRHGKQIFDAFFEGLLADGTLPFWMPDTLSDGWPLDTPQGVSILRPDGKPLCAAAQMLCLIGDDMPRETLRGQTITVTFSVWKLP